MNNKGVALIIMLTISGYVKSQHTLDIEVIYFLFKDDIKHIVVPSSIPIF